MCGCRKNAAANQQRIQRTQRNLQPVRRAGTGLQITQEQPKLPPQQQPPQVQQPNPFTVAADLRRIQKLRQEAIRKSLNR